MANDKLSIKEQIFCNEYVKNKGDGVKAVISAGYVDNGTGSTATQCSRLLKKQRIFRELARQNEFVLRSNAISKSQIVNEQYQLFILAKEQQEYKTASSILESLTKLLGYAPAADSTKQINHNIKFESLLKDITPQYQTVAHQNESKLIN